MNDGWNSCGCVYLDADGNPITGPGSGADGTPIASCNTNWGLIAAAALAAILGVHLASGSKR